MVSGDGWLRTEGGSTLVLPPPQTPLTHACPPEHAVPHAPQWSASLVRSTQPQGSFGIAHTHPPAWQSLPYPHALPQAPQFRGSLSVSTHALPQAERPAPHADTHAPWEQ
jgi:hypothetical protein